jgi:hypothetical protein
MLHMKSEPPSMDHMYHVAAFVPDGELEGSAELTILNLSPRWLSICSGMLVHYGDNFRASFGGPLGHIELKLVSANGAGLGMFFVHGILATSTAYFRGHNSLSEQQVLESLLSSLRESKLVQSVASSRFPFEALRTLQMRPLHVVIPWAPDTISDQDQGLVQEISTHFAGAYLCRPEPGSSH